MSSSPDTGTVKKSIFRGTPWQRKYKTMILASMSLIEFAIFCGPFTPIPLEEEICDILDISKLQYSLLFSLGDFIGIIGAFLCGVFIVRIGRNTVSLTVLTMFVIGQFFSGMGTTYNSYPLLFVGQLLLWCGVDCWIAIETTYLTVWFKNLQISFAIGMATCFCYTGVAILTFSHPLIFNRTHKLYISFWLVFILMIFALICGVIMAYVDGFAPKDDKKKADSSTAEVEVEAKKNDDATSISKLPCSVWLLTATMVTILQCIKLFDIMASSILQNVWGLDNTTAGMVVSIRTVMPGLLCFGIGIWIYNYGKKPLILLTAAIITLCSMTSMALFRDESQWYVGVTSYLCIGIAHTLFSAAIWPCASYAVDQKTIGFALGIMMTSLNTTSAITTSLVGWLRDKTVDFHGGFLVPQLIIITMAAIGVFFCVWLVKYDYSTGGRLSRPEKDFQNDEKEDILLNASIAEDPRDLRSSSLVPNKAIN